MYKLIPGRNQWPSSFCRNCTYLKTIYILTFLSITSLSAAFFSNGIIHLPFLELSIIILSDIKVRIWSWSANSIEPGQTAQMAMSNHFRFQQNKGKGINQTAKIFCQRQFVFGVVFTQAKKTTSWNLRGTKSRFYFGLDMWSFLIITRTFLFYVDRNYNNYDRVSKWKLRIRCTKTSIFQKRPRRVWFLLHCH